MPSPYLDAHKVAELVALEGRAKVSYPYDDTPHRRIERVQKEPLSATGVWTPTAYGTADQQPEYASCILTGQTLLSQDDQYAKIYRVWEDLPGPVLVAFSRIDPEDGSLITQTRQNVLTNPANVATASGTTSTTYEARDQSSYVSVKIVTTTAYDGVVRSLPARVNLRLPRVLAGIAVSYNVQKGEGDDASTGNGESDMASYSVNSSASARASSSLNVTPEVYLPLRDRSDEGESVAATIKQVYLSGAITEAAMLAKLTTVYEVIVSGAGSVPAGTFRGNASNYNGVIWFSQGSYVIRWTAGVWAMGTEAGILAGNYWKRTAAATAWLGNDYAPQGSASGTATVAVGRTVAMMPTWGTQEVNLIAAGGQASVSSNASATASATVNDGGASASWSNGSGFSVSRGGNQSRIRVEPTLHGAITIAKSSYSDTVNATAAAGIEGALLSAINAGSDSGFSPTHAQTVQSYVRIDAAPISATPTAKTISANSAVSKTISGNTVAAASVVTTSTAHGFVTGDTVTITGTNSTPVIDGTRVVTVLSSTTFSVPVTVTVLGTAGTVKGPTVVTTSTAHQLGTGDSVVISGSNSTPTIDGTRTVTWISSTTFTVPVIVTVAGTAGSVQGPAINASTTIPATEPTDTPTSGIWCLPQYESAGKDAIWTTIHATIVDMTIFATAPIGLGYSDPAASYAQGLAIVPNQPFYRGGGAPTSYAISPSIPAGLAFSTTTGIITGAPTSGQNATAYVVTATNGAGLANTTISIAISVG